jgi:hypothetical protein
MSRPVKTPFDLPKQERLRDLAVCEIKKLLLPNAGIFKIILIGSSVKGTFGKYEPPGFRGSLFSDFDFIVFVRDEYRIPAELKRELNGRPFQDERVDLAYRKERLVEGTYDGEIFFIRESTTRNPDIVEKGEAAGIPLRESSTTNKFIAVYP